MRLARAPMIASVLLTLATAAPSLAWGADGIHVMRADSQDLRAFDAAIGQSRVRESAPRANIRTNVGTKVQTEARKVREQRERDIQERKSFGQWVKSNNNPSSGKGSAAAVGDDGNGTGGGSSSTKDRSESRRNRDRDRDDD